MADLEHTTSPYCCHGKHYEPQGEAETFAWAAIREEYRELTAIEERVEAVLREVHYAKDAADDGGCHGEWRNSVTARAVIAAVLNDHETEHIADLGEETFGLQHPLRERLEGSLFDCDLHERLAAAGRPPCTPGRYRVIPSPDGEGWTFETITTEGTPADA